jgi:hypothetical protein
MLSGRVHPRLERAMLGFSAIGECAISDLPLGAIMEAARHLQYAAAHAERGDEAGAAVHLELALPYFTEAISWSRKKGGRPPLPEGASVPEQVRACSTMDEARARFPHLKESTIERYYRG